MENNIKTKENIIDTSVLEEMDRWEKEETFSIPHMRSYIFLLAVFLIINVTAVLYVNFSKNIYYWESSLYWNLTEELSRIPLSSDFFKSIYSSTFQTYNYIAALIPALTAKIFGFSRLCYILTVINCYLFPSVVLIYLIMRKHAKNPILMTAVILMACPFPLYASLYGLADAGGLTLCYVCFLLYFRKRQEMPVQIVGLRKKKQPPESGKTIVRYVIIGICLGAMVLFRRHFSFFAVSFMVAMLAEDMLHARRLRNFIVTAAVFAGIILMFPGFILDNAMPAASELVNTSSSSLYAELALFAKYYGMAFLIITLAISLYMCIVKKDRRIITLWVQMILCYIMFLAAENHRMQNLILYTPPLTMILVIFISYAQEEPSKLKKKIYRNADRSKNTKGSALKKAAAAVLIVIGFADIASVYLRNSNNVQNDHELSNISFLPSYSLRPVVREDADELLELKSYLNSLVSSGEKVIVLATSDILNGDIIRNAGISLGYRDRTDDYISSAHLFDSSNEDIDIFFSAD